MLEYCAFANNIISYFIIFILDWLVILQFGMVLSIYFFKPNMIKQPKKINPVMFFFQFEGQMHK